jgi:phosphoribosylformylglycinamidine cyclo-ligase
MKTAYSEAGVKAADEMPGFKAMLRHLAPTFGFGSPAHRPSIDFGFYANVIPVTDELGIAISTDGVGTKILVAEALNKFDTIGIDCVAMNVNDVICVGARPLSMVDYIAVETPDDHLLEQLGIGFAEGARQSGISIPGGELAQIPSMLKGALPGAGLDLVGTCIGTVPLNRVITGQHIEPGDAIIGLASSGIHSNGLTLARQHLDDLEAHVPEFSGTVGEELLRPTAIYVKFTNALLESGANVKVLAHITSDGFLNLSRVDKNVTFDIQELPETPPVFEIIQRRGEILDEDMFLVYNMGIGFVAVVPEADVRRTLDIAEKTGYHAWRIGMVTDEAGARVHVRPKNLVGYDGRFHPVKSNPRLHLSS